MRGRIGHILTSVALVVFPALAESLMQHAGKIAPHRANPYAGNERAREAGQKLFDENCGSCHGEAGKGNGRAKTPPLTTRFVHDADPGALFWVLRNGSPSHSMPSFQHLPEAQRWQIITYLQSLGEEQK
ncbi:MAG: cytochrome c [Acidobacteriaceae bacterium]|nr:cytochrome c [Acidobacteriaceae bacterium]